MIIYFKDGRKEVVRKDVGEGILKEFEKGRFHFMIWTPFGNKTYEINKDEIIKIN